MSDAAQDPAAIERDLAQTRSRLGAHLDELQNRLTPGQVLDDLMGYFRGGEGAAIGGALVQNLRANPLPAALTGVGLAWLMATTPRNGATASRDDHEATLTRVRAAEQGVARDADDTDESHAERVLAARGQAMGLARDAQESAQDFGRRVSDALAGAQETVARKAQDARDSLGAAVPGGQVGKAIAESPLALGAFGLAAGALLGLLLPRLEQEQAALGGAAAELRAAAAGLARQAMDSGRNVAAAVADKAAASAEDKGLTSARTPEQWADAALHGNLAADVAHAALQAGETAARREAEPAAATTVESPPSAPPAER